MKPQTDQPKEPSEPAADAIEATDDAELASLRSENERLRAEAGRLRNLETAKAVLSAAGAISPALLAESVAQQIADGGEDIAAVVNSLRMRFPEQFNTNIPQPIDAGAGRVAASPITKAALAKMTPAEIASLDWEAVKDVLARG